MEPISYADFQPTCTYSTASASRLPVIADPLSISSLPFCSPKSFTTQNNVFANDYSFRWPAAVNGSSPQADHGDPVRGGLVRDWPPSSVLSSEPPEVSPNERIRRIGPRQPAATVVNVALHLLAVTSDLGGDLRLVGRMALGAALGYAVGWERQFR